MKAGSVPGAGFFIPPKKPLWYHERMTDIPGATFVFIGRPGSGKGTQIAMFKEWLAGAGYAPAVISVGDAGRELAKKTTPIGAWVKKMTEAGEAFPSWLAGALMVDALETGLATPQTVLIIDGSPRRVYEAELLDDCMKVLGRPAPVAIVLDIDESESRARLTARARTDDTPDGIERRLAWFKSFVEPVIGYYGNRAMKIRGIGGMEAVRSAIVASLAA